MTLQTLFQIIVKGGAGSGNWVHPGDPPNRGGSGRGGGLGAVGLDSSSSLEERKRTVGYIRTSGEEYARMDNSHAALEKNQEKLNAHYNIANKCGSGGIDCDALKDYTGYNYQNINGLLRKGEEDITNVSKQKDRVKGIDNALDKLPRTPKNMKVFRGVSNNVANNMTVGDTVVDKGFMSTSLNKRFGSAWSGAVAIEIRVPKGSKGAYLGTISNQGNNESEFLLPRGSKLKVLSKTAPPKSRIIAELVQ